MLIRDGIEYLTVADIIEQYGMDKNAIHYRVHSGLLPRPVFFSGDNRGYFPREACEIFERVSSQPGNAGNHLNLYKHLKARKNEPPQTLFDVAVL